MRIPTVCLEHSDPASSHSVRTCRAVLSGYSDLVFEDDPVAIEVATSIQRCNAKSRCRLIRRVCPHNDFMRRKVHGVDFESSDLCQFLNGVHGIRDSLRGALPQRLPSLQLCKYVIRSVALAHKLTSEPCLYRGLGRRICLVWDTLVSDPARLRLDGEWRRSKKSLLEHSESILVSTG